MKLYLMETTQLAWPYKRMVFANHTEDHDIVNYSVKVLAEADVPLPDGYTTAGNGRAQFYLDPRGDDATLYTRHIDVARYNTTLLSRGFITVLKEWKPEDLKHPRPPKPENNMIKIYLVKTTKAQMMAECGIKAMTFVPGNNPYYEHEVINDVFAELPAGYTWQYQHDSLTFSDPSGAAAELVTEPTDNGGFVASLVSANGIAKLYEWSKEVLRPDYANPPTTQQL